MAPREGAQRDQRGGRIGGSPPLGPRSGRRAAQCATSWRTPSSRSWLRSGSGAVTINDFIWVCAWARAATALRRATRSARSASTAPARSFGMPVARPAWAARAAASASTGSDLPCRRRVLRSGPVDLDQLDPGHPQMQRQPGPVGAGALDPDLVQPRRASAATPAAARSRPGWSGTADAPAADRSGRAPRRCGCPCACPPHRSPRRSPLAGSMLDAGRCATAVSSWACRPDRLVTGAGRHAPAGRADKTVTGTCGHRLL